MQNINLEPSAENGCKRLSYILKKMINVEPRKKILSAKVKE